MYKIQFIALGLLCFFSSSFGQDYFREGFIISLNQDTLKGEVAYRTKSSNYKTCLFRSSEGEKEYTTYQISGYGFVNENFYTSEIVDSSFVEVLVSGKISLYKLDNFYLVKKGDNVYPLESKTKEANIDGTFGYVESNQWRGAMLYLINDCLPNSSATVSHMRFEEKSLTKLVNKYNGCTGDEFEVFKETKPWSAFGYGISVGLTNSRLIVSDPFNEYKHLKDTYSSVDLGFGLIAELRFPRLSENFAFQLEPNYLKVSFSDLKIIGNTTQHLYETHIDLTTLSVPLIIKMTTPLQHFRIFYQVGVTFDFQLDSETTLLIDKLANNEVTSYKEREVFNVNSSQIGVTGGIGILRKFKNLNCGLALKYIYAPSLGTGFLTKYSMSVNSSKFSVNLIVMKK